VTAVYGTYQCADMHTTARGFGIEAPIRRHACVYTLSARAFMGLPWPKKITGKRDALWDTLMGKLR
jgi:hypothetical protein